MTWWNEERSRAARMGISRTLTLSLVLAGAPPLARAADVDWVGPGAILAAADAAPVATAPEAVARGGTASQIERDAPPADAAASPSQASDLPSTAAPAAELAEMRGMLLAMQAKLTEQSARIDEQERRIAEQNVALAEQRARTEERRGSSLALGGSVREERDVLLSMATGAGIDDAADTLGANDPRLRLGELAEKGTALTPRGRLTLQPEVDFSSSGINRFNFRGIGAADVVLIGNVDATDVDREILTSRVTARLGVTDRFELSLRVPYVRRRDKIASTVVNATTGRGESRSFSGRGLGDIELGAHYEFPRSSRNTPVFVGNVIVKSTTGKGPFDVDRGPDGRESEAATGSGFWSIEPSVTALYATDPALLFGNLSYTWNLRESVDRRINTGSGAAFIREVDPGDALGLSFGLSFAFNERSSFRLGYAHRYVLRTSTDVDGDRFESETLQLGSFQFGLTTRLKRGGALDLSLALGVTDDAPDARLTARMPFSWALFD